MKTFNLFREAYGDVLLSAINLQFLNEEHENEVLTQMFNAKLAELKIELLSKDEKEAYARECCQASLNKAAEASITLYPNSGSLCNEAITDPSNIVIL